MSEKVAFVVAVGQYDRPAVEAWPVGGPGKVELIGRFERECDAELVADLLTERAAHIAKNETAMEKLRRNYRIADEGAIA